MLHPLRPHLPAAPRLLVVALCALATACSSAPDDVLDAEATLRDLELRPAAPPPATVARVSTATFDAADGLDAREASALALHLQPRLRALRAEVGVARAQLVEAGLLPDPTIGWESGNVVADFLTDRKSSANSYLAGFLVEWEVPRPGELGAREGEAGGRIAEARAALLEAEWRLVADVHAACVRLAAVEAALALAGEQAAVAERTAAHFAEARRLGEVTALQARLAGVAQARVLADQARLLREVDEARQAVLGLIGLPPTAPLGLADGAALLAADDRAATTDAALLVAEALRRRPDLAAHAARHAQAEARLRLEEARRWPRLTIGTGIGLSLPIFSRFNAPAVETARRARVAARQRFEAAAFDVRREVHAARAALATAAAWAGQLEAQLLPAVEDTLRLTRAAVQAGEFTAFDVLTAQTQALEAQTQLLAARARRAEARVALDAAIGRLVPAPAPASPEEEP